MLFRSEFPIDLADELGITNEDLLMYNQSGVIPLTKKAYILRTDAESQKSYYNNFVACMNGQFPQEAPQVILSACQTLQCYRATHQLLNDLEGGNNV